MKATIDNTAYRLTLSPMPGNRLPKPKGSGALAIVLNGAPYEARTTTSKGWSAEDKVIPYIWVEIEGKAYYLALDFNAAFEPGIEVTTSDGVAERVDPVRVPRDVTKETARRALLSASLKAHA